MEELKNFKCLLPQTNKVLSYLVKEATFLKNFVLVGGSGLSFYLDHRKSEDLDFFTYCDYFNIQEIIRSLKYFNELEIINQTNNQIDLLLNKVKVTFFNSNWEFLKPDVNKNFNLAQLNIIAGMKVNTLFLRATYRDYYDLYSLSKNGMSIKEMYEYGKKIMDEINFKLFCTALIYVDDIVDDNISHLLPKYDISKQQISEYFEEKIKEHILKTKI